MFYNLLTRDFQIGIAQSFLLVGVANQMWQNIFTWIYYCNFCRLTIDNEKREGRGVKVRQGTGKLRAEEREGSTLTISPWSVLFSSSLDDDSKIISSAVGVELCSSTFSLVIFKLESLNISFLLEWPIACGKTFLLEFFIAISAGWPLTTKRAYTTSTDTTIKMEDRFVNIIYIEIEFGGGERISNYYCQIWFQCKLTR